MTFTLRRGTPRRAIAAGAAAAGIAAASGALAFALSTPFAAAAVVGQSTARLIDLNFTHVDALNEPAFAGVYGRADSSPNVPEDPGDFTDPDGVLNYVDLDGPVTTRTALNTAEATAQADLTAFSVHLSGSSEPLVVGTTVDDYAQCVLPPYPQSAFAYARLAPGTLTVLGAPVATPGATDVPYAGAEIGHPELGDGVMHVVVTRTLDPDSDAPVPGATSARAGWEVAISASVTDPDGAAVYDGPLMDLKLAQVTADCSGEQPTPTPTETTPTPTPTETTPTPTPTETTPTPTPTETTPTPTPTETTPTPTCTPTSASPSPSSSTPTGTPTSSTPTPSSSPSSSTPMPSHSPSTGTPSPSGSGHLPSTGVRHGELAGLGTAAAAACCGGLWLLATGRRRRNGRHL